jgi:hypothetical protein
MYMKHDLQDLGANIIYLRPVATEDLPDELRAQAGELETLFEVHNTKGEQVALVAHPAVADELAAAHQMQLVTVH